MYVWIYTLRGGVLLVCLFSGVECYGLDEVRLVWVKWIDGWVVRWVVSKLWGVIVD